jgi:hypothetical protein
MSTNPGGLPVILRNPERGDRRGGNSDPETLLGDELAPRRYHIGREHSERALSALQQQAIEAHKVTDPIRSSICDAGYGQPAKAVPHEDDVLQVLHLDEIGQIIDECIKRYFAR